MPFDPTAAGALGMENLGEAYCLDLRGSDMSVI